MRSINYLTDRPAKILFSICFPLVGVNLLLWITTTWTNQLYSRYVGADAFAITGYLSAVTTAFANIVSSIMLAAWIKTAHTFALNDKEACSQQIFNGIAAATIIDCTLALLLLLFCHPLFSVLHIPEMIHASAKRYFILYTVCYLPVVIAGLLLTVVNGTSGSARLFWINIIVVLLNYAAAALLLAAFHAGIVGLALCSGLGALFQLAFDFFLFRKAGFHISVIRQMRHIDWITIREIIRYGLLIALQNLLCTSGYLLVTYQANRYLQLDFISVLNVALPLTGIMSAFGSACMAYCPQNYAAHQPARLRSFLRLTVICSAAYGLICFLIYAFLGKWYYGRLFENAQIIALGADFWRWQGVGYIFLALVYTLRSFFDSVGLSRLSLLSGLGELLGNVVCALWLIPQFGNIGRSLSYPLGWTLACLFLSCAFLASRERIFSPFFAAESKP